MRKLGVLLLSATAFSQTVTIPSLPVPIPPRLIPAQSITINIPKCSSGCKVSFVVPSTTVPAQTLSTPSVVVPVSLGKITLTFTCSGPDLQHLACTAQQQ